MPSSPLQVVGGHKDTIELDEDDMLIKTTNPTELDFYQSVNIAHSIYHHIPHFYGALKLHSAPNPPSAEDAPKEAIVLENLTDYFSIPNICDIKLGKVLYDDHATPEKQQRMEQSSINTTSHATGIRFTGFKVWNTAKEDYDVTDKAYGKSLTPQQLPDALRRFIPIPHSLTIKQLKFVVSSIHSQLLSVRDAVSLMPFRSISSSILIVHEADSDDFLEEQAAMVKLIDFAHTRLTDADTPDMNILAGIDTLIDLVYNYKEYITQL
ncbi:hypothetical protein E3P77_02003 [Wallemia ichthyophaga]|nr:hypothetical protein E3P77_02003 [Wallemia ichthyophaga]